MDGWMDCRAEAQLAELKKLEPVWARLTDLERNVVPALRHSETALAADVANAARAVEEKAQRAVAASQAIAEAQTLLQVASPLPCT